MAIQDGANVVREARSPVAGMAGGSSGENPPGGCNSLRRPSQSHQNFITANMGQRIEEKLLVAIKQADLASVKKMLEGATGLANLDVNPAKLLGACIEHDRKDILYKLIKLGANINQTNEDSITCLMMAAKKSHTDSMLVLLSNGAKVNAIDNYEWTALMYASYYGNVECVRILLDAGAFVNVFDMDHLSSLIWASGRGHVEVVRLLLKFGAKVDTCDKYGTTPLIWACRKGHNEVVECLLQAGANVNATGMFGWSALLTTVRGNHLETTKILLRHDCVNVNTCDSQRLSPLMIAAKDGLVDIAKLLIEKDAFVNLSDRYGHTALIHATKSGHVEIVKVLINAKADIDHIGFDKKSATFWAIEKGYIQVVRTLLEAKPNLEIISNDGETCLIRAVKSRRADLIRLLLDHGAKVSATDKYGDTVLHTAIRMQSKTIVELLLTNPKNCQLIYKPNKRKETPFSIDQNNLRPIFPSLFDDFENRKISLSSMDYNQHSVTYDRSTTNDLMGKPLGLQSINVMNRGRPGEHPIEQRISMRHRSSSGASQTSSELSDQQDRVRTGNGLLNRGNGDRDSVNSLA